MKYFINKIKTLIINLLHLVITNLTIVKGAGNISKNVNFNLLVKKLPLLILIIILMFISFFTGTKANQNVQKPAYESLNAPAIKARQKLNKEFLFSLRDEKGKKISDFKYIIETADLQDEIIVKGQRARSIKGKTFLILNLKISNSYNKGIVLNSKDYIRLTANNKNEMLASDVHNDPVQVQAISTKLTRLGFPISVFDKNLTLHIGEIDGKKETITLNFK